MVTYREKQAAIIGNRVVDAGYRLINAPGCVGNAPDGLPMRACSACSRE